MAKQRRNFTREFKVEAVRRIVAEGKSLAEVARELDLGESLLRSWKRALTAAGDQAFPGKGNLPAVEEELRRLRAENQRLRMDRDVLKKATAFFAKESS
jgi:transposase